MTPRDDALSYGRRGWAVLPCHSPATSGGCTCGRTDCASPAKHPRLRRGLHEATTDPDLIAAWWRRWPDANVALRTGAGSGLVVIDVDPARGGDASLAALTAAHGHPDTLTVATGGGGRHLYFTHPGSAVRNSAGVLGAGLDVRGDGGYVLAPPSRHVTGGTYRWDSWQAPAPLPAWLHDLFQRPMPAPDARRPPALCAPGRDVDSAWARQALAGEVARVRHAEPGRRNTDLNRAAFCLGQLVASGHLDADVVTGLLTDAALAAGLGPREVAATLRSGLAAGSRSPRHPPDRSADLTVARRGELDLRRVDLPLPPSSPAPRSHPVSPDLSVP